ncbi:MAG: hypothetical protein EBQ89_04260 [Alphaproteobacteria bacterium]|nr:hypothetical protein [Alphaproteobacteria bacterium]
MLVTKDFFKTDVNRFDIEYNNDFDITLELSNVISWDIIRVKMTKEELSGLANFIRNFLEPKTESK